MAIADGVVLVDSDYIKERKVFGHVLAAFRYGREDLDVLGLTFRKDLYLASSQIFPLDPANKRAPTRLQVFNHPAYPHALFRVHLLCFRFLHEHSMTFLSMDIFVDRRVCFVS